MARVDGASLGVVQPGRAVHVHILQHAPQLGLHVVLENLVHTLLGPLLIEVLPLGVHPEHHPGDVEDNHGPAEGAALPGLRDGLGAQAGGVGHAVIQLPVQVIGPSRPLQPDGLAGDAVVLRVGQGVKRLGEAVAPLAQGLAVPGDGEVHPIACGAVDAVFLHKVQAASGRP